MYRKIAKALNKGTRDFTKHGLKIGEHTLVKDTGTRMPVYTYPNQTYKTKPIEEVMTELVKKGTLDKDTLYRGVPSHKLTRSQEEALEIIGVNSGRKKKELGEDVLAHHYAFTDSSEKVGVPTSTSPKVAERFSWGTLGHCTFGFISKGAVLVIDKDGINSEHIIHLTPKALKDANDKRAAVGWEPLPMEKEVTLQNIPAWSIAFAKISDGIKSRFISNPLYIDYDKLSESLKKDFRLMNDKFNDECIRVSESGDKVSKTYQQDVGSFYARVCVEQNTSPEQIKDILRGLPPASVEQFNMIYAKEMQTKMAMENESTKNDQTLSQGDFKDRFKDIIKPDIPEDNIGSKLTPKL